MRISPLPPLRAVGTGVRHGLPQHRRSRVVSFFAAFGLPQLGSNADFLKIPVLDLVFSRLTIDLPYFRFSIIALSFYTGAFVCEAFRSGINAVAAGPGRGGPVARSHLHPERATRGAAPGVEVRHRAARLA